MIKKEKKNYIIKSLDIDIIKEVCYNYNAEKKSVRVKNKKRRFFKNVRYVLQFL